MKVKDNRSFGFYAFAAFYNVRVEISIRI